MTNACSLCNSGVEGGASTAPAVPEHPQRSGEPRPPEDERVVRGGGMA